MTFASRVLSIFRLRDFRSRYFFRGLVVWLGLRLAVAAGARWARVDSQGLSQGTALLLLGVVAAAVYLDARRRNETLVLENLGIPGAMLIAPALFVPVVLELLVL